MKHRYQKIFLRGLLTFLPIGLTIFIIFKVVELVDGILNPFLQTFLPIQLHIPGFGLLVTMVLIFIFGLMLNNLIIRSLLNNMEKRMSQVPLFKAVYSPLKDLMNLFSKQNENGLKSVVLVTLGDSGPRMIGLVTRDDFTDLPQIGTGLTNDVVVYIPWSYGLGGLSVIVDKKNITPIDIPVDRALSLAITAWVKAPLSPSNSEEILKKEKR